MDYHRPASRQPGHPEGSSCVVLRAVAIEPFFNKIKQYHRMATRHENLPLTISLFNLAYSNDGSALLSFVLD
jgi:hypothetical protein